MHACVCVSVTCTTTTQKKDEPVLLSPPSLSNSNPLIWGCCLPDDPHGISHFTLITCLLINISLSPFFVFFLFRYFFIFYLRLPLPVFPYSHDFVCLFKNAHNQKEGIFFSLLKWWDMQKPALKRSNSIWSVLCYLYARRMPSFRRFQKARRLPIFFILLYFINSFICEAKTTWMGNWKKNCRVIVTFRIFEWRNDRRERGVIRNDTLWYADVQTRMSYHTE
jgi:hypothetical protein